MANIIISVASGIGSLSTQANAKFYEVFLGDAPATFEAPAGSWAIKVNPAEGWEVGEWSIFPNSEVDNWTIYPNYLAFSSAPEQDLEISVKFVHPNVDISLSVQPDSSGNVNGCIDLGFPVSTFDNDRYPCEGASVNVPVTSSQEARAYAIPKDGWKVQKWEITSSYLSNSLSSSETETIETSNTYIDFDISSLISNVSVKVYFEDDSYCSKKQLSITTKGKGFVTPSSGEFCYQSVVSLCPLPYEGYAFNGWEYSGDGFEEQGKTLLVTMIDNVSVTAVFLKKEGYVSEDYAIYYSPSEAKKVNEISFEYTKDISLPENSPSSFKIFFYKDSLKKDILYVADLTSDNKKWYYYDNNGQIHFIENNFLLIESGETKLVSYIPDILPVESIEKYRKSSYSEFKEYPLIRGVRYYIDIYANDVLIESDSVIFPSYEGRDIDIYNKKERNEWICSAQGYSDVKISNSLNGSYFPSVASNNVGFHQIAWQSRRGSNTNIYGGIWESERDKIHTSGQGIVGNAYITQAISPIVVADAAENFTIIAENSNIKSLKFYSCPLEKQLQISSSTDNNSYSEDFERYLYPFGSVSAPLSIGELNIEVYDEDVKNSIIIDSTRHVDVVENTNIRLKVSGLAGMYAIRLRDSEDSVSEWTEWINIDGEINSEEDNDAYFVDSQTAIVSYTLSPKNGMRKICAQILTMYGLSSTKCVEFYLNRELIEYSFRFYSSPIPASQSEDGSLNVELFSPFYKNFYVLKDGEVYFRVFFNKDIPHEASQIKFNVFHEGMNDIWGESLIQKEDNRTFIGKFIIEKEDGVFARDGKAFIQIVLPENSTLAAYDGDKYDKYNMLVNNVEAPTYQDYTAEEIYQIEKKNTDNILLDESFFENYYSRNDTNATFGN